MHGQRRDDRLGGALRGVDALPGVFELGRPRVVLYTRDGCHLCDEARREIVALRDGGLDLELVEIDIESDDRLHAAYLERIPVIDVGGKVISELGTDEAALLAAITSQP